MDAQNQPNFYKGVNVILAATSTVVEEFQNIKHSNDYYFILYIKLIEDISQCVISKLKL